MADINFKKLKKAIFGAETAAGKLMDHPVIQSGIHEGDRAIGKYALMPNTVDELSRRFPKDFPGMEGLSSEELEQMIEANKNTPEALRPQAHDLEERLSDKLLEHVVSKQKGDIPRTAAAWNAGHNMPPARAASKLKSDPGVRKYAKEVTGIYKTPDALLPNELSTEAQNPEDEKFNLIKNLLNLQK